MLNPKPLGGVDIRGGGGLMPSKQCFYDNLEIWLTEWNAKLAEIEYRVLAAPGGIKVEDAYIVASLRARHAAACTRFEELTFRDRELVEDVKLSLERDCRVLGEEIDEALRRTAP